MAVKKWPALKAESEYFLHFDAIRILGAMLVVAVHWSSEMAISPFWRPVADRMDSLSLLVDMFFLLSGFVICHIYAGRLSSLADYGDFLKKRVARLGPLHWATTLFFAFIGVTALITHYKLQFAENYDMTCLAPSLLAIHAFGICKGLAFNYPSWSISAEFGCYALLPLYLLLYRFSVWLPGALGVVWIAALAIIGTIGPDHHPWYGLTYDFGVLRAIPAFGIGVTLYGVRDHLKRIPFASFGMYATLIAIVMATLAGVDPGWLMPLVYLLGVFGAAADASGKAGPVTRAIAPYGTISLSVYLIHIPFAVLLFTGVFTKVLHLGPEAKNVAIIASLPMLLFVSYVSLVRFETPARRWISKLGSKPNAAPAPQQSAIAAKAPALP